MFFNIVTLEPWSAVHKVEKQWFHCNPTFFLRSVSVCLCLSLSLSVSVSLCVCVSLSLQYLLNFLSNVYNAPQYGWDKFSNLFCSNSFKIRFLVRKSNLHNFTHANLVKIRFCIAGFPQVFILISQAEGNYSFPQRAFFRKSFPYQKNGRLWFTLSKFN